jgi:hypothetical protein
MDRTKLIHYLFEQDEGSLISKYIKGNTLWILRQKEPGEAFIVSYRIFPVGNREWSYAREIETTPFSSITCPRNFLTRAPVLCEDWREKVVRYSDRNKELRADIRQLYKFTRKEHLQLQVEIQAEKDHVFWLHGNGVEKASFIIESYNSTLAGRYKNDLLYSIPIRFVSAAKILDANKEPCQTKSELLTLALGRMDENEPGCIRFETPKPNI